VRDNGTRYERNESFIYRSIVNEAVLVPIHQDVADMECIYTLNDPSHGMNCWFLSRMNMRLILQYWRQTWSSSSRI